MFFSIQPPTRFTLAETYLLPSRFIWGLFSPNTSRQLELGYSLPSGDVQNREEVKRKIKIEMWKARRMGRAMKHRKRVLFIGFREQEELQYYTCHSSSYMNQPDRRCGKRWQPQNYRPGNIYSFRQSFINLFSLDHLGNCLVRSSPVGYSFFHQNSGRAWQTFWEHIPVLEFSK